MLDLPTGTVTFFLTDIEGSTRLHERCPDAMQEAIARHDALAADTITRHHGCLIKSKGEGDSLFAVFARATDAVAAAGALQQAFVSEPWPEETPLRVRIALHTGEALLRDGDYYGAEVNRCARIRAVAHGRQVLLSESTTNLVRSSLPPEAGLRDLGSKHLKDLLRPERLCQLLHPALPADFPPVRSLEAFRHNLPVQLTSFIGRGREIKAINSFLSETRLLTLTGSGGCGKSRLALQVVADLVDKYPDGVWLVRLEAIRDPKLVVKTVADALKVREEPERPLLETLTDYLKPKSLLLVLDNCEHLIRACADTAKALLLACPGLWIIATSRQRLGVRGEFVYSVPALLIPPSDRLPPLDDFQQCESVRLFAERARFAQPTFAVTSRNAYHIALVCHKLEGIPLALELAAARVPVLTVKGVAERLDDLTILEDEDFTEEERHQTLTALIDWSYHLLTEAEQTLLRRLSMFAGGWTLEAAEAVCCGDGIEAEAVIGLLSRLVHASLVIAEDQEEEKRYRLLETIRQYGQIKLEKTGEFESVRNRHLNYFQGMAEEAEPKLTGAEQATWLKRLEAERDNLRTALTWASRSERRLYLASALWRYWMMRGYFSEGRSWLEGALARSQAIPAAIRAKALNGAGVLATRQADFAVARSFLAESLEIRRNLGDERGAAETLNNLGNIARETGNYPMARSCYEESLRLYRKQKDKWGMAATLNNLGILERELGDNIAAGSCYEESLAIYRELGDAAQIATTANNLADLACSRDDYKAARLLFEECLTKFRELENRFCVAIAANNLGETLRNLGDDSAADLLFMESLKLNLEIGDRSGILFPLWGLARVAYDRGGYERAIQLLAVLEMAREKVGLPSFPSDCTEYHDILESLRAKLTPDCFAAAWEQGKTITLEDVIADDRH